MTIREVKNKPVPEVVNLLEEMLDSAKRGEILSVAVAYIDDSKHQGSCRYQARDRDILTLAGALDVCKDVVKSLLNVSDRPK